MDERDSSPKRTIRIAGRRWRATDPAIPEKLRAELVKQLMHARRSVKASLHEVNPQAERRARARVNDAKIALGERGEKWWEDTSESGRRARAAAAMRTLLRQRGPDKTICPSDIARILAGDNFAQAMPLVRTLIGELSDAGEVEVRQRGARVDAASARGPIRVALLRDIADD